MQSTATGRRFVLVTFDGGGNLPPAIGIAQQLVAQGHSARLLGHRGQRSKVEGAGLPFRAFEQTPDYDANVPISPEDFAPFLFDHIFFEPLMAADLEIELRREPADAVIVDCMLTTPLVPLEARQLPSAVLVHTLYRFWEGWKLDEMPGFPRLAALRASHGLPPVATLEDGWRAAGRVLVTSALEFDAPTAPRPKNTVHVGPIAARNHDSKSWSPKWGPETDEPLILVSFSTTSMDQEDLLNRISEALSTLPVRVLMTTSSGIRRDALRPAANTTAVDFAPHDSVLPRVALAICHAGHGTVMAALKHGVPMLCLPMGRDQPMVAAAVAAAGAGRVLDAGSDVRQIRAAVAEMLSDATYRQGARRMASQIARADGAAAAAQELLALVESRSGVP